MNGTAPLNTDHSWLHNGKKKHVLMFICGCFNSVTDESFACLACCCSPPWSL